MNACARTRARNMYTSNFRLIYGHAQTRIRICIPSSASGMQAHNQTLARQPAYAAPNRPVHIIGTSETEAEAVAAKEDAVAPNAIDDVSSNASGVGDPSADSDHDDDGDDDGFSEGGLAAVILAVLLGLALCLLLLCVLLRGRDKRRNENDKRAMEQKLRDATVAPAPSIRPGAKAGSLARAPPGPAMLPWDTPTKLATVRLIHREFCMYHGRSAPCTWCTCTAQI